MSWQLKALLCCVETKIVQKVINSECLSIYGNEYPIHYH